MNQSASTEDMNQSAMHAQCVVEKLFAIIILCRRNASQRKAFETLVHDHLWQILEISSTRVLLSVLDTCADFLHPQAMTAVSLLKTELIAQSCMQPLPSYDVKRILGHGLHAISTKPDFIVNFYRRLARDVKRSPLVLNLLHEILRRMRDNGKWSLSYFDFLTGNQEAGVALSLLEPRIRQPKLRSIPSTVIGRLGNGAVALCIGCTCDNLPQAMEYSGQKQIFEVVVLAVDKVNPEWLEWMRILSKSKVIVVQSSEDRALLEGLFLRYDFIVEDFWLDEEWCIAACKSSASQVSDKPAQEWIRPLQVREAESPKTPHDSQMSIPNECWIASATQTPSSFDVLGTGYFLAKNVLGSYCIPKEYANQSEAKKLSLGGIWEEETMHFMRQQAGSGDIVHAGTSFGDMIPGLSCVCSSGSLLWAFEPNSTSHKAAILTLQYNQLSNVILSYAALGGAKGWADILVRNHTGNTVGGRSRIEPDISHPHHLMDRIAVVALDEIIPRHRTVSLIHLDIEGSELLALQGAVETIRAHHPVLIIETVPKQPWFEQIILKDLGYRKLRKVDGNTVFVCSRPK